MNADRKQATAALFGRASATYDTIGPRFFTYFGGELVKYAGLCECDQVLDVACGAGAVSFAAAELVGGCGRVIGVDLSPDMVERARQGAVTRGLQNVEFQVMDAEKLVFPDATFDTVFCGMALFFLPDMQATLAEFRRVLMPGGVLAVSMWGPRDERWDWLFAVTSRYLPKRDEEPPATAPTPRQTTRTKDGLRAFIEQADFTGVHVIEEAHDIHYADEAEWLAVQWSHGARSFLESTPESQRDAMIAELFTHARALRTSEGIPERQTVLYGIGIKP